MTITDIASQAPVLFCIVNHGNSEHCSIAVAVVRRATFSWKISDENGDDGMKQFLSPLAAIVACAALTLRRRAI
jgi:hypothetical protein